MPMGTQVRALKTAKDTYTAQVCIWGLIGSSTERTASECVSDQRLGWAGAGARRVEGSEQLYEQHGYARGERAVGSAGNEEGPPAGWQGGPGARLGWGVSRGQVGVTVCFDIVGT